jgi:hypothetical protein
MMVTNTGWNLTFTSKVKVKSHRYLVLIRKAMDSLDNGNISNIIAFINLIEQHKYQAHTCRFSNGKKQRGMPERSDKKNGASSTHS